MSDRDILDLADLVRRSPIDEPEAVAPHASPDTEASVGAIVLAVVVCLGVMIAWAVAF